MKTKINLLALSALLLGGGLLVSRPASATSPSALPSSSANIVAKNFHEEPDGYRYLAFDNQNFELESCSIEEKPLDSFRRNRLGTKWRSTREHAALDAYCDGWHAMENDKAKFRIRSTQWEQRGQEFITFTMSGGNDDNVCVEIYDVDIVDGNGNPTIIKKVTNNHFSNTDGEEITQNMILRIVSIPEASRKHKLFLRLVDDSTAGWSFLDFGALQVAQTAEDVTKTLRAHALSLRNDANNAKQYAATLNLYQTDDEYAIARNTTLTNLDFCFNDGNQMVNYAWDFDFAELVPNEADLHFGDAVTDLDVMDWLGNAPFNREESYFNGQSFIGREDAKWRFLTPSFQLTNDYITVKMGGNSSRISIYEADENHRIKDPATPLVQVTNQAFHDYPGAEEGKPAPAEEKNIVKYGVNLNTMVRHIIDARAAKGKEVIIAIEDYRTGGGWGLSFIDEIITSNSNPQFRVDTIVQDKGNEGVYYGVRKDVFYTPANDVTAYSAANKFLNGDGGKWEGYYNLVRNEGSYASRCGLTSEQEGRVFAALDVAKATDGAEDLIRAAQDYHRLTASGDWWNNSLTKEGLTVGASLDAMKASKASTAFHIGFHNSDPTGLYLAAAGMFGVIAFSALFLLRRKKKQD